MPDRDAVLGRWASAAAQLRWDHPWAAVHDGDRGWFVGGQLNVATNAVDRHVADRADTPALHWEGEPGDRRTLTYRQLHDEVVALADALRGLGVRPGDRVGLHVGLVPEAVVAMLACGRLGAVHSVLPAVLPADALTERLADLRPRVLLTQDGAWRHGVVLPLKHRADEALTAASSVEHTVVIRRTGIPVPWFDGDRWYDELVAAPRSGSRPPHTPAVPVDSDHPVLIAYIADRGGRPTGVVHGTGGLLTYAAELHRTLTGPDEVVWVPAELGWLACQVNGILGPLVGGGTAVVYEGMLDTPSHRRAWEIIARYGVTSLVATPSVVRALRTWVGNAPTPDEVASLTRIVTAGEAIDAETARWLRDTVAAGHADVVDAWGQTELGGIVAVVVPAAVPAPPPDPGLRVETRDGRPVAAGVTGDLVLRHPWPGAALGVHDRDGLRTTVPSYRGGALVTGDRARLLPDGELELLGRSDRVFSVSGQLVSATEIKFALEDHPFVARAEVVDRADASTGRAVVAVVQPLDAAGDEALAHELQMHVRDLLGGLALPRNVTFVDRFPEGIDGDELAPALQALSATGPVVQHLTVHQLVSALDSVRDRRE